MHDPLSSHHRDTPRWPFSKCLSRCTPDYDLVEEHRGRRRAQRDHHQGQDSVKKQRDVQETADQCSGGYDEAQRLTGSHLTTTTTSPRLYINLHPLFLIMISFICHCMQKYLKVTSHLVINVVVERAHAPRWSHYHVRWWYHVMWV